MGMIQPNSTQVPNALFDELMKILNGSELKVVLWIARKTFGWHRDWSGAGFTTVSKTMEATGLSNTAVIDAYESLERRGIAEWRKAGRGREWRLVVTDEESSPVERPSGEESSPVAGGNSSPVKRTSGGKSSPLTGEKSSPVPVKKVHRKPDLSLYGLKENLKQKEKEEEALRTSAPSRTRPAPKPASMRRTAPPSPSSVALDPADELQTAVLEACGLDAELTRSKVLEQVVDVAARLKARKFTAAQVREAGDAWPECFPDRDSETVEPPHPQQLAEWVGRRRAAEALRKASGSKAPRRAAADGRRAAPAFHGIVPMIER